MSTILPKTKKTKYQEDKIKEREKRRGAFYGGSLAKEGSHFGTGRESSQERNPFFLTLKTASPKSSRLFSSRGRNYLVTDACWYVGVIQRKEKGGQEEAAIRRRKEKGKREPEKKGDSTGKEPKREPVMEDQVLEGSLQENSADRAFVQIDEPNWTFVQVARPLFVERSSLVSVRSSERSSQLAFVPVSVRPRKRSSQSCRGVSLDQELEVADVAE
ncbi:hypothetical protein LR48_Vigan03g229700 [Vigna angularis]|uniref:Uncharacterized protein n=1 Tax=Phaseolus angularis TaxID=3914 RepID=A0A0L9U7W0_PHAAN|nr:hypothetical protein LR48_Vigan03g229700 [Vigna angularis]